MKLSPVFHLAALEQEKRPRWPMLCGYAQCEREWWLGEHGDFLTCPEFSPNKNNY